MPDPYGRYANLMARHPHLKSTIINPPNIRDWNGALILPSDYSVKLGDQTPVFVTVKLRLWVFSLLSSYNLSQTKNHTVGKFLHKVRKKEQPQDSNLASVRKMEAAYIS